MCPQTYRSWNQVIPQNRARMSVRICPRLLNHCGSSTAGRSRHPHFVARFHAKAAYRYRSVENPIHRDQLFRVTTGGTGFNAVGVGKCGLKHCRTGAGCPDLTRRAGGIGTLRMARGLTGSFTDHAAAGTVGALRFQLGSLSDCCKANRPPSKDWPLQDTWTRPASRCTTIW